MNIIYNPPVTTWDTILARPTATYQDIEATVKTVFEAVKNDGNQAVLAYTEQFDKVKLDSNIVLQKEFDEASTQLSTQLKEAIQLAKTNIEKFHAAQRTPVVKVDTQPGVSCWQEKRPIQKVGLYIPGGTAPLFSTILMLAIPARLAGCKEIVICTPPDKNGKIHPAVLYTAALCGVTKVIKAGGIQAIAGLTFGTSSIPKVYKIFGPGNQYVTVAKQLATQYGVAIDMPAGPSELMVVADHTANAEFVASDLLSQAEHGVDSQVILVTTSPTLLTAVKKAIELQLQQLSRKRIAEKAMVNSKLIVVNTAAEALEIIDNYGPEHLIIATEDEDFYVANVANAGSVFIGNYTPESAGDYASGTNHTLPTNGYAKQYSGVNLDSFLKSMTFQKILPQGIKNIGPAIVAMATAEGLDGHEKAVTLRLQSLTEK